MADDEAIDAMFLLLLAALEVERPAAVAVVWKELESCLVTHMDEEERRVMPRIAAIRLRDALSILQEHRFLRARMRQLGDAIERGRARLVDARSFRDELRAHARHEADVLSELPDDLSHERPKGGGSP